MAIERKEFNETNFYSAFCEDLRIARSFVIIQSPFIRSKRAEMLLPIFTNCVQRGVRVCVFIQTPREENPESLSRFDLAIESLTQCGVHVSLIPNIHEKLAVIDGAIVWRGSLNILSQSKSSEEMFREVDPPGAYGMIRSKRLDSCTSCRLAGDGPFLATDIFQSFGRAVRQSRKKFGWTQQKLAKLCKTDQQRVSLLERGQLNLQLETLQKFCNALLLNPVFVPWDAKHFMARQFSSVNGEPNSSLPALNDVSLTRESQKLRTKSRSRKRHRFLRINVQ